LNTTNIITKLKASDARIVDQAFSLLYREHYPVIRSFITNNSGSEEDAADIFQDALIVLYDKVRDETFELKCALKTFIYSICRNLWLKKLNGKKQDVVKTEAFSSIELEPNIADILEDTEQSRLITKYLQRIGGDTEKILVHFYFDGMKTEEVTQRMGYANEQVTRNKKSRCLKKLRGLLLESTLFKDFRAKY
jgi:RNA polymerase sigma factor (sigma-70 family)